MYSLLKALLFQFDPEKIHHAVTAFLKRLFRFSSIKNLTKKAFELNDERLHREVLGLKFKNPVGLAAGFDKNAQYIEEFAALGFGFIEIGTVTPLPQPGNDKPRMFRLPADEGLINRMGFNNQGVDVAADRLKNVNREELVIGGNIGKNKLTPNEEAVNDYIICFDRLFEVVDYFVVNVSSPNTPGLRELQEKEPLMHILNTLQERNNQKEKPKPILLKIAPDLTDEQLNDIVEIVQTTKISGIIATNTTLSREGLTSGESLKNQMGGLSGKPLRKRSTEVIAYLHQKSKGSFPIIGVGGIHSPADALEKLNAGASLVQLYTGFIYEGPGLIKEINRQILNNKA
ncbi:MAG: quinone-dependent dihydroorotate dehydrogenase [Sphingobacteriaceae bacterium]